MGRNQKQGTFFARFLPGFILRDLFLYNGAVILLGLAAGALCLALSVPAAILGAYLLSEKLDAGIAGMSILIVLTAAAVLFSFSFFVFLLIRNIRIGKTPGPEGKNRAIMIPRLNAKEEIPMPKENTMPTVRAVKQIVKSRPTLEGAGVFLNRVFGFGETSLYDPFLLLDDFRSDEPERYIRGFPWHPHRGIETITYMLAGKVAHGDSMGNEGIIGPGDVQWMTAGSGIIHQEMPEGDGEGRMYGFQLWANLPAAHKMMDPRYREVTSNQIPEAALDGGVAVKVIAGEVSGTRGPVRDIVIDPEYLHVTVPGDRIFRHAVKGGHTVFAYVIGGRGKFGPGDGGAAENGTLVLFEDGEEVLAAAAEKGPLRFLLISGKPIGEPVAWQGPIVMNTREELALAFEEYRRGTFIKHPK